MVARDGIEPPTPAFSGLLTDSAKWFRISAGHSCKRSFKLGVLGPFGIISATFASSMFPYRSPPTRSGFRPPTYEIRSILRVLHSQECGTRLQTVQFRGMR